MKAVRAAVLGCGQVSAVYEKAFRSLGRDVHVVMAFDRVPQRALDFSEKFPGCIASSETEPRMVAQLMREHKVDICHILLPHDLHCVYAVAALEAGIHVLTEKPMATSVQDARRMIEARNRSGCQLGVIFQNRLVDGVQKVRRLMESGSLGKLRGAYSNLNWFRSASYYQSDWKGRWAREGGGVVIDQAIHSIDLVRYMTGKEAVRIMGHTARRVLTTIEVEDEADAAIVLEDGSIYSFFACSYYCSNSPIRIEISWDKATVLLTRDRVEITWNDERPPEVIRPGPEDCCHTLQLRECYRAFREGRQMLWTAEDGLKTLEIALGIYESARINAPVILNWE